MANAEHPPLLTPDRIRTRLSYMQEIAPWLEDLAKERSPAVRYSNRGREPKTRGRTEIA
jgi:hypothetical protein